MLLILHGTPRFACLPVSLTIIPSCISKNILKSWVCSPDKGTECKAFTECQWGKRSPNQSAKWLRFNQAWKKKREIKGHIKGHCYAQGKERKLMQDCWKRVNQEMEDRNIQGGTSACMPWFVLSMGCSCLGISTCDRDTPSVVTRYKSCELALTRWQSIIAGEPIDHISWLAR